MYVAEVSFESRAGAKRREAAQAICALLASWRSTGQILDPWPALARRGPSHVAFLLVPERASLVPRHDSDYGRKNRAGLKVASVAAPRVRIVGLETDGEPECRCRRPAAYVLYTTYLDLESPLRCGDCFRPVPLYRLPRMEGGVQEDAVFWAGDFRRCDALQMNCATGERFGTREVSRLDSSLSRRGRAVCDRLQAATGVPVFHYLYRYGGRSVAKEEARRCPGCDRRWLLREPWHRLFDFRCERCRLVSNIAFDVQ